MGSHPVNLAVRFLLEIIALGAIGMWGYKQTGGWYKYVLAIAFPLIVAAIWGTFAVPDDPSRSGSAPIPVNGIIRLVIELGVFAFGVWSLYATGYSKAGLVLVVVVVIHYALSYDRIMWLLNQ